MTNFKFFVGKPKDEELSWVDEDMASWIWFNRDAMRIDNFEFITETHNGIHSFLRQFPYISIIVVSSITGPNGFVHNQENDGTGWGFDILNDPITIVWVRRRIIERQNSERIFDEWMNEMDDHILGGITPNTEV